MTDRYKKNKRPAARAYKLLLSAVILLFFLFVLAAGAEEAEQNGAPGEGEQATHFKWSLFLGQILNSTILFGGLIFLLRKPLLKYLGEKSVNVTIDLETREENLGKTTDRLAEIRNRLDKIEAEVSEMKNEARQSGEEEKKKIRQLGQLEAHKIAQLNEEEINRKFEIAIRDLQEKIADLAIEHFKNEMLSELDDRLHEKIILENIELIGETIERK